MLKNSERIKTKNVFYLPSGRIFLFDLNGYIIEATEMRDVLTKDNPYSQKFKRSNNV